MIFPDVDYVLWAEKYDIEPVETKCIECGKTFLTTMPLYSKLSYGLMIPNHGCGWNNGAMVLVSRDEEFNELMVKELRKLDKDI